MKKKLIALLCVILMLSMVFVGCDKADQGNTDTNKGEETTASKSENNNPGSNNGGDDTEPEETEEVIPDPNLPSVSYDRDIAVVQSSERWREEWNADPSDGGKEGYAVLQKALFNRNAWLEEKYGIEFEQYEFKLAEATKSLQNQILTNTNSFEFLSFSNTFMVDLALAGALRPVQNVPNIDLTKPYWYGDLNSALEYNDTNFFVIGSANLFSLWTASCVWYNMDLADDLGIEADIFDMVNEHKWTLEAITTFAEYSHYIDDDGVGGVSKGDRFGIGQTNGGWYTAYYGSGLLLGAKDDNGKWKIDVSDERIFDRILDIVEYQNDGNVAIPLSSGIDQWSAFRDGNLLFLIEFISVYERVQTASMEYGILPSPLLEEGQDNYYTSFHRTHSSAFGIPSDVPEADLEMIGAILEDANYMARVEQWPAYYEVLLKSRAAKNPETADMIEIIFENLIVDPMILYDASLDTAVRKLVSENGTTAIESTLKGIIGTAQDNLDKAMNKFDELINRFNTPAA